MGQEIVNNYYELVSALKKGRSKCQRVKHSFWRRQGSCDPSQTSGACSQRGVVKRKKMCGDLRLRALPRQRPGFVEGLGGWVGMERLRGR